MAPTVSNNKQSKRRNRTSRRREVANLVRQPAPSTPAEVIITLRLGFVRQLSLTAGAPTVVGLRVNDPVGLIDNWSLRAADFAAYRVVALDLTVTPVDTTTAQANRGITYASVLFTSTSTIAPPASTTALLELPGAKVRPFSVDNPRSSCRYRWRATDLNSLIFGATTSAPLAQYVTVYAGALNNVAGAGGNASLEFSGWMQLEFKGLTIF